MDLTVAAIIDADTPPLNPKIANGLALDHMQYAETYLDQVFRSAAKGFPEGLQYMGFSVCLPQEEFGETTRKKGTRRVIDIAPSFIYMVKYHFQFKGEDLPPRYMYLPYVTDAGYITLSGSTFNISPVLSDRVISIDTDSIFVRLLRDRLTFERTGYHFIADDKRETVQVSWSMIYHRTAVMKKLRPTVKANCAIMHYLLCKYGFTETFLKFGKCKPIVGGAEINSNVYPEDEWVICSSTQVKPKGYVRGFYEPCQIRIAVRREEYTPMVKNMIGGFFYVADHFSSRIKPEYVDSKRTWMILLGHIIWSGDIGEGDLYDDVAAHFASLEEYLDSLVSQKLRDIGIEVNDIYELMGIILEKFNEWILANADNVASMYEKELSILYYSLYGITSAIFNMCFKLKAASKKELTSKEVVGIMNMTLRSRLIFFMTKGHGEVTTVSSSSDNKATKITSLLCPQSRSNHMGGRSDKAMLSDPASLLHPSIAEVGGYLNLPKAAPDGRSRLNPHVHFNDLGVIMRNPVFKELLDSLRTKFKR